MIKFFWLIFIGSIYFFSMNTWALERPNMLKKTKDALLSYEHIEKRADYLVFKLKNLTFGEYSENILIISPLLTGKLEFQAHDMKLYYNYKKNKGGVKYSFNF